MILPDTQLISVKRQKFNNNRLSINNQNSVINIKYTLHYHRNNTYSPI